MSLSEHVQINANKLLSMLDTETICDLAQKTEADYHARKLTGITMLKLMLQGVFLFGNKLSQGALSAYYSSEYFVDTTCQVQNKKISKAAISKRLRSMPAAFFQDIYCNACQKWTPLMETTSNCPIG